MRNLCENVLSAADHLSSNGNQIWATQLVSASFQAYFSDATAAGTFKLQSSNDKPPAGSLSTGFVVTNWVDIPNQSASIVAGASAVLTVANMSYQWIRAVYTDTAAGVQTISTVADVSGSLNSKYFLISSASVDYYVWMNVNSAGVDPMIANRTGVEVDLATGATNSDVATAVAAALDALPSIVSTATGHVATATNAATGPFAAPAPGTSGFTVAVTGGGSGTINVQINALGI